MFDISSLKRDADLIAANFAVSGTDVITKKDCSIIIPYDYIHHKLAVVGNSVQIASVFAILVGNTYAAVVACATVVLASTETKQIKINGVDMLQFIFPAGSAVASTRIVKDSDLAYEMNKYFYSFGRVPWFLNYDDIGELLRYHKEYAGLNISPDNIPFEIVASRICRDSDNKFKHYRFTPMNKSPVVVPFNSVIYNATNTTAKILGNYLSDGFTSALLNPSDRVETVETLLRS